MARRKTALVETMKPQAASREKPGRKPIALTWEVTVEFVPVPDDQVAAWRAGLRFLVGLLYEEKEEVEKEQELHSHSD